MAFNASKARSPRAWEKVAGSGGVARLMPDGRQVRIGITGSPITTKKEREAQERLKRLLESTKFKKFPKLPTKKISRLPLKEENYLSKKIKSNNFIYEKKYLKPTAKPQIKPPIHNPTGFLTLAQQRALADMRTAQRDRGARPLTLSERTSLERLAREARLNRERTQTGPTAGRSTFDRLRLENQKVTKKK